MNRRECLMSAPRLGSAVVAVAVLASALLNGVASGCGGGGACEVDVSAGRTKIWCGDRVGITAYVTRAGNPVGEHTIRFSLSGSGSVDPTTDDTDADGLAYTSYTSGTGYGTVTITGTDLDDTGQPSDDCDVTVVKLEQVKVYYRYRAYPFTSDSSSVLALVKANGSWYCDLAIPNNDSWQQLGIGGDPSDFAQPAGIALSYSSWPGSWPDPSFLWRRLPHIEDKEDALTPVKTYTQEHDGHTDKYRYYMYNPYLSVSEWSGWGGNGLRFARGTRRYQVKVTGGSQVVKSPGPTTSNNEWSQDCDASNEYAVRISTRDASLPTDPNGLEYLKWISAFLGDPYEWGGHWFGGKASGSETDRSCPNIGDYEGWSTDCSGLVSAGARFAGYNWSPWRPNTTKLRWGPDGVQSTSDDAYYSSPIAEANVSPGDILVKAGTHVATVEEISGDAIRVLHATGGEAGKPSGVCVWTNESLDDWVSEHGYTPARLMPH